MQKQITLFFWGFFGLTLSVSASGWAQPTDNELIRIAVISDMNNAYGSTEYDSTVHATVDFIINDVKPDLVLSGGDMIAGQKPNLSNERVRDMWRAFDKYIADRFRKADIPFAFTIGNHDGSGHPPHQRDRDLAEQYWKASAHQPDLDWSDKAGFPFYYSFNVDNAHIAIWDASTATVPDSNLTWIKKEFGQNSSDADFKLLVGHLPLYGVAPERDTKGNVLENPKQIHLLLKELDVDLYLSGHHHAFYPAHKDGIQFFHSGAIGSGPRKLLQSDNPAIKSFTILEIYLQDRRLHYTTYNVESWNRIPHSSLPDLIESRNGTIFLTDEEITLDDE